MTEAQFNDFAEKVKHLKARPTDDELLELYALFKQGTVGDVNTARPGMLDFKGKAKWDRWNGKKGQAKEAAQAEYIQLAKRLIEQYNS